LTALIWLIGLGTLISGAVGVSNIMLVTVRERTKEIGIRRAIGASPWVIMKQILAESTLLTLLSGVLGIVAAVGVLRVAEMALKDNEMFSQNIQISFSIAIGGLLILLIVGLLAGILPARRALAIKPIEALNEE
jgi:putative ABC transport system permease protein